RMAVLGGDAFGVELHAMHRMLLVLQPHDEAVSGPGGDRKATRQAFALDDQRVITRDLEPLGQPLEDALARMIDLRDLAVHGNRGAYHCAAIHLADRLVPKADAQGRDVRSRPLYQLQADAGLVGRAGAWRQHDAFWGDLQDLRNTDLVIAEHLTAGT